MWLRDDLIEETEWSRTYAKPDRACFFYESKFITDAESLSLWNVIKRWTYWSDGEKLDFCQAFDCAPPDNAFDLVRHIAADAAPVIRSTIAQSVARLLPTEEALAILMVWLDSMPPGETANIVQAIGLTGHPAAHSLLQQHLIKLLKHLPVAPISLQRDNVAYDLLCCVESLHTLGEHNATLDDACQRLRNHPSDKIRLQADRRLSPGGTDS